MKLVVITAGLAIICGTLTIAAPKIIGADSRKENLAAPSLVSPRNNPVVMVIPERDTPGIMASA